MCMRLHAFRSRMSKLYPIDVRLQFELEPMQYLYCRRIRSLNVNGVFWVLFYNIFSWRARPHIVRQMRETEKESSRFVKKTLFSEPVEHSHGTDGDDNDVCWKMKMKIQNAHGQRTTSKTSSFASITSTCIDAFDIHMINAFAHILCYMYMYNMRSQCSLLNAHETSGLRSTFHRNPSRNVLFYVKRKKWNDEKQRRSTSAMSIDLYIYCAIFIFIYVGRR